MEQFIVGFVRGSHGISGEFKVESTSGYYEHFAQMKEVTLRNGRNGDSKLFKVESVNITVCFGCIPTDKGCKRIMAVRRGTALTVNSL